MSYHTTYLFDVEHNGAETAREMHLEQLLTRAMGTLFPSGYQPQRGDRVLDVACGPGGWALDVAFTYPHAEVIALDKSPLMVRYAAARARTQRLGNISFEAMDALALTFPHTFACINLRCGSGFLTRTTWPLLLSSCVRHLLPGGLLHVTELELPFSNSPALQQLGSALSHTMHTQGRTFSQDGSSLGVVSSLAALLHEAGLTQIDQRPFVMDGSAQSPCFVSLAHAAHVSYLCLKPYFVASGALSEHEIDELMTRMLHEMAAADYCCLQLGVTAWGRKPREEPPCSM